MSEQTPAPQGPAPESGALSGSEWWATLEPLALQDEIEANRRGERWLLLVGLLAVLLTGLALVVHRLTTT
ncbi:hypothetical protein [Nocardioides insulae]|uniref:hypothetical protein n=1 Tax=Nocardioides insulae TaxID=394734 RepID=UPI00040C0A6C|nr:hypothetical protein [Nocardioides insulae]